MRLLKDYISADPIESDIAKLGDTNLLSTHPEVNNLIINLVVKYLLRYLGIGNVSSEIKSTIKGRLCELYPGDNIFAALEKLSSFFGNPLENDLFGIECLADIQITSALVKEIIFGENFEKREDFFVLDLGTGTGILLVAGIIAGIRSRARQIGGLGMDMHRNTDYVESLINDLFPEKGIKVRIFPFDITNPAVHQSFNSLRLSLYISETISMLTPPVSAISAAGAVSFSEENIGEIFDPFPTVLSLTSRYVHGFAERVRQGKIGMFPDLFNGLYVPNGYDSTLQLRTGNNTPTLLPEVGQEFQDFESFDLPHNQDSRWSYPRSFSSLLDNE